jgi:acetolactate synthase I/II/III large subunit
MAQKLAGKEVGMQTGGQLIVQALEANGVQRIFCVPGESYLAVLDALHESPIRTIVCRQEGGAAMMADCEGSLTGKPGICFVTRGPGATNASAGVHIAAQDSVPMILFVGQIARGTKYREAFQEVDYEAMFGTVAKWVVEITDAARIPELVTRAFATAMSGRPGPVIVSLPEDMLRQCVDVRPALPTVTVQTYPGTPELDTLSDLLTQARAPIMILGGSRWTERSVQQVQEIAELWQLPVGCSFRRQMLFDHLHPNYAGDVGIGPNPKLAARIREADLVLLIGGRMGEMPSSDYTLLKSPVPDQQLVHIHPDAQELGRVYRSVLPIHATPEAFVAAFSARRPQHDLQRQQMVAQAHDEYLTWSTPPQTGPGKLHMGPIMEWLQTALPSDAILSNGAGNYATWVHRFHRFRNFATQAAPTSGSMGYGTPAAVAAKAIFPERVVVAFAGDGCFMMNGQEFATAVQYNLPIIVIVVNNGMYGTIRMHQEREYPGRVSATDLINPDFAALARAYGGHGEIVEQTSEFAAAFERAKASGRPALIELRLDPEALTPTRTLSQIRAG